jgi:hypothetical protein
MSLDEYNRHATLGPLAGPATSASAAAGQDAYQRTHPQPGVTGTDAPAPTPRALLGMLLLFAVVFLISLAGFVLLPKDSLPAIFLAPVMAVSGLAFAIAGLFLAIEAVKFCIGWLVVAALELRLFRIAALALVGFVLAEVHWYTIEPIASWMVALGVAALALIARFASRLRPWIFALGMGATAYVLTASHVYERHSLAAMAIAGAAAALSGGAFALLARRRRKRS